ncbi:MAG: Lrp/AsnC family transcriptional regulator [Candidatus Aenigmarchaeota archaeon]|nr:Lrp/AsnC family transcriptional regulator [Candidatus Aenigmarchaeota archaeon]
MTKTEKKYRSLYDEKDHMLMKLLQRDGRIPIRRLAKKVDLSVDTTRKRIKRLIETGAIDRIGAFINPFVVGFPLIVDVKIKTLFTSAQDKKQFIDALDAHPNVSQVSTIMGGYDFTCVIVVKNPEEFEAVSAGIRQKFHAVIIDWVAFTVTGVHKIEEYPL